MWSLRQSLSLPSCSDKVFIRVEIVPSSLSSHHIFHRHFVSQEASDSSEPVHELIAFLRFISDEFESRAKVGVMMAEPFSKRLYRDNFQISLSFGVLEVLVILLLHFVQIINFRLILILVLDLESLQLEFFVDHDSFERAAFECCDGFIYTEDDHAGILRNFLQEFRNQLLFLHEFNISERFRRLCDGLVKPVFSAVRYVDDGNDRRHESLVEKVGLRQFRLEISATSQNQPLNIWHIVLNEISHRQFCHFPQVVVTLFVSETGESVS